MIDKSIAINQTTIYLEFGNFLLYFYKEIISDWDRPTFRHYIQKVLKLFRRKNGAFSEHELV